MRLACRQRDPHTASSLGRHLAYTSVNFYYYYYYYYYYESTPNSRAGSRVSLRPVYYPSAEPVSQPLPSRSRPLSS